VAGLTGAELVIIRGYSEAFTQDLFASLSPAIRASRGNCSTCCRFCVAVGPAPGRGVIVPTRWPAEHDHHHALRPESSIWLVRLTV
jgi:hypothetical protein